MIQAVSNETNLQFKDLELPKTDIPYMTPFNASDNDLTTSEWSANTLTKFSNYLYNMQINVSHALLGVEKIVNRKGSSFSFKSMIGSMNGIIHLLMSMIIIFGALSYSRVFGYAGTLSIIIPRKVNAYFGLDFEIIPIDIQSIIEFSITLTLLLMLVLLIHTTWFRKHTLFSNYGRAANSNGTYTGWTLTLNITHHRITFCRIINENIYLRTAVTVFKKELIKDLQLVNCCMTWYIKETNGVKYLKLNEDVHLYLLDSNGDRRESKWQPVRVRIDTITWNYDPEPTAFDRANSYGQAFLTLTKDQTNF